MAEKKTVKKADKAAMPKMVKGTTSSGLKYVINPNIKDDMRILMYLDQITDTEAEAKMRIDAFNDFLKLIFGDQVPAFLNEVAARHGGVADVDAVNAELKEILQGAGLKNS